jgi:hypothetical protein
VEVSIRVFKIEELVFYVWHIHYSDLTGLSSVRNTDNTGNWNKEGEPYYY